MVLLRLLISFVVDGGMLLGSCEDDGETREKGRIALVSSTLGYLLSALFSC